MTAIPGQSQSLPKRDQGWERRELRRPPSRLLLFVEVSGIPPQDTPSPPPQQPLSDTRARRTRGPSARRGALGAAAVGPRRTDPAPGGLAAPRLPGSPSSPGPPPRCLRGPGLWGARLRVRPLRGTRRTLHTRPNAEPRSCKLGIAEIGKTPEGSCFFRGRACLLLN